MKGNSLFIATLAENHSIFEAFISLAFKVSMAERMFQYRQKSWFHRLLLDYFNVTLSPLLHYLFTGTTCRRKVWCLKVISMVYTNVLCTFSPYKCDNFLVSNLTFLAIDISVGTFSIHPNALKYPRQAAVYHRVTKESVRVHQGSCHLPVPA